MEAAPILRLRQSSGFSGFSWAHSHSAAVSAEAEPRADNSGDDSDSGGCRGLEHGWIAAHGPKYNVGASARTTVCASESAAATADADADADATTLTPTTKY